MLLRLLVATALVSVAYADKGCYDGAILSYKQDKCFHTMFYTANFSAAESFCKGYGGNLASVHGELDSDQIVVSMNISQFWLGGHRLVGSIDNRWAWTDGSNFDYNNWAAGEPSPRGNCLLADTESLLWGAVNCSREAYFVCETASTDFPTTPKPYVPFNCTQATCDYFFYGEKLTWDSAQANCRSMNGDLISVHDSRLDKSLKIWATGQDDGSVWTGGRILPDSTITWVDGSASNYSNFAENEPANSTNTSCIARVYIDDQFSGRFVNGWVNEDCEKKLPFVCEIPRFV